MDLEESEWVKAVIVRVNFSYMVYSYQRLRWVSRWEIACTSRVILWESRRSGAGRLPMLFTNAIEATIGKTKQARISNIHNEIVYIQTKGSDKAESSKYTQDISDTTRLACQANKSTSKKSKCMYSGGISKHYEFITGEGLGRAPFASFAYAVLAETRLDMCTANSV